MSESKVVPVHSDDEAVDRFAAAMKKKLAQKRAEGRGGWNDRDECTISSLEHMLHQHYRKGDVIDIANFCMMLHQRGMPSKWRLTEPREFAMAQVCIDMHYALGVKWGEDIYAKIKTLTDAAPSADQGGLVAALEQAKYLLNDKPMEWSLAKERAIEAINQASAALQSAEAGRKDVEPTCAELENALNEACAIGMALIVAHFEIPRTKYIQGNFDGLMELHKLANNAFTRARQDAIDAAIAGKA